MANVSHPKAWIVLRSIVDGEEFKAVIPPITMDWERNNYLTADTLKVTFDYTNAPLDPRVMQGARISAYFRDDRRSLEELVQNVKEPVFLGAADTWKVTVSGTSRRVTINARDNTSFFLDKKVEAKDFDQGVDVNMSLYNFLIFAMEAVDVTTSGTGPIREMIKAFEKAYKPNTPLMSLNLANTRNFNTPNNDFLTVKDGESWWSVISRVCQLLGVLNYIDRDGRLQVSETVLLGRRIYGFTYGKNLDELTYVRDYKGLPKRRVVLRAYNRAATKPSDRVVEGAYPAEPLEVPVPKTKGRGGAAAVRTVSDRVLTVSGGYTKEELEKAAELVYRKRADENLKGSLRTFELYDEGVSLQVQARFTEFTKSAGEALAKMDTSTSEPKPLWLCGNGDALVFGVSEGFWEQIWPKGEALRHYLRSLGMEEDVVVKTARIIQSVDSPILLAAKGERFQKAYYISEASHRFKQSSGYSLTIKFLSALGKFE